MALIPTEYPEDQKPCLDPSSVVMETPSILCNPPASPLSYMAHENDTTKNFPQVSTFEDASMPWPSESKPPILTGGTHALSFDSVPLSSDPGHPLNKYAGTHSPFRPSGPLERSGTSPRMSTPVFSPQHVPDLTYSPSPDSPASRPSTSHGRRTSPGHVKRPCNAFILFRSHAVTTNLIPKEVERDHRNISRIISHMWHSLDDDERKLWERQAEIEKQRHRELHPNYKYKPSSRRNNVLRRTVRRLSSTERQCERIADAILKSCGREGIKRQRTGKHSPSKHPEDPTFHPPSERSEHCDVQDVSPTGSPSCVTTFTPPEQPLSCMSSPSPSHLTNQINSEVKPCEALQIRRSSSAPPLGNGLETVCAPSAPLLPAVMSENLPWLLGSPLVGPTAALSPVHCPMPSPVSSQVPLYPGPMKPHEQNLQYQPHDAVVPAEDLLTLPPAFFDENLQPGLSILPFHGLPSVPGMTPAYVPPVSPRTQDHNYNPMAWASQFPAIHVPTPVQPASAACPAPTMFGGPLEQSFSWAQGERARLAETKSHEPHSEAWAQNGVQSFFDLIHGTSTF